MTTLSQLIEREFGASQEETSEDVVVQRETSSAVEKIAGTALDYDGIEKLAQACEFIGTRGIINCIEGVEKEAMAKCPGCGGKIVKGYCAKCKTMVKKAMHAGPGQAPKNNDSGSHGPTGSPSNNAGEKPKTRAHIYVGPSKQSPPMGGSGSPTTNADKPPGDNKGANTAAHERMSHPGLRTAESAIAVDKATKSRLVSPALGKVLGTLAFADPVLKHDLANASRSGERNIHSGKKKTASELGEGGHDADLLRQALIFKLSQKGES